MKPVDMVYWYLKSEATTMNNWSVFNLTSYINRTANKDLARECLYNLNINTEMSQNEMKVFTTLAHTVTPHILLPVFSGPTDHLDTRRRVDIEL